MSKFYCLSDEIEMDSKGYKIDVCITAPNGERIDEFTALRVLGLFKKICDEDYELGKE